MVVEPCPDLLDLIGTGEVHLVKNQHVGEPNLTEFEFHQRGILWMREDLVRVDHADDAVEPDPVAQIIIAEGREDSGGIGDTAGFEQDILDGLGA